MNITTSSVEVMKGLGLVITPNGNSSGSDFSSMSLVKKHFPNGKTRNHGHFRTRKLRTGDSFYNSSGPDESFIPLVSTFFSTGIRCYGVLCCPMSAGLGSLVLAHLALTSGS